MSRVYRIFLAFHTLLSLSFDSLLKYFFYDTSEHHFFQESFCYCCNFRL